MRLTRVVLPALFLVAGLPGRAPAQILASEPATVSQTVDGTKITIEYFRPRVRGRDSIFETQIYAESVWTPGANWATTFELSKGIELAGTRVPAGKYSTWFDFNGPSWTLILDPRHRRFHMNRPDSTAEQLRITVPEEAGPFTEVLAWEFPEVRVNGGTVRMRFATRQVTLDYRVDPTYVYTMPQPEARPFTGRYTFSWASAPGDTTPPAKYALDMRYRNGALKATFDPLPDPTMKEVLFFPIRQNWFRMATLENGEVFDVWTDAVFEFTVEGGRATRFEIRGDGDEVWGTGTRER
jgi:hypothetical protein